MQSIELTPAYGRTYADNATAVADWENDRDFLIPIPGLGRGVPFNRFDARRKGAFPADEYMFFVTTGPNQTAILPL